MENNKLLQEKKRMQLLAGLITEVKATTFQIYHDTFSSAVQLAHSEAEKRGYTVDENDWFNRVTTGPGKPQPGQTNRFSVGLLKNGIEQRKQLHIQVYGMESGKYELNFYIQ